MLFKFKKVEEITPKLPEITEKIYPRPYNSNSIPSEFGKVKDNIEYRLHCYDFYPELIKGYQCYPECMLLFDALSSYLDNFEQCVDQNADTAAFLLRHTDINEDHPNKKSDIDTLFNEVARINPDAQCIKAYQAFKSSSLTRQKEAITLLYQHFTFERYLINREEAYI